jgi:hypothetical protein
VRDFEQLAKWSYKLSEVEQIVIDAPTFSEAGEQLDEEATA